MIEVTETATSACSSIPFVAPAGKGVSAISWQAENVLAPPRVDIVGDGTNATAVALYDPLTKRVTGVRITSHGVNYTHATAYFVSGTQTNGSVACELADNVSGSFVKTGSGTFTFYATNTYAGATVLRGGILKCGIDHAIPASSTIVLAGGTLDMNGKTLSDDSTIPTKWGLDVTAALASENGVVYAAPLVFPTGATFELIGTESVPADARSRTLLSVPDGITGDKPTLAASADPHFAYVWSGNALKLRRLTGTTLIVR